MEVLRDIVRESQELVELVLKAILRELGVELPHWHDVGSILEQHKERLPEAIRLGLEKILELSLRRNKLGELVFYLMTLFLNSENCEIFEQYSLKTMRQKRIEEYNPNLIVYNSSSFAIQGSSSSYPSF